MAFPQYRAWSIFEYKAWHNMIQRCTNPKCKDWQNYGGRGITVCAAWLDKFENFWIDMGMRPPGKTLDRVNNDGPYSPENCKWSTRSEQQKNQRKRSSTGHRGVRRYGTRWRVTLCIDGVKQKHVGYFATELEAIQAYAEAHT